MRTERIYEIGDQVLIRAEIVKREFGDRGDIKYKLKDNKTGKMFDWFYTNRDLVKAPTSKKKAERMCNEYEMEDNNM